MRDPDKYTWLEPHERIHIPRRPRLGLDPPRYTGRTVSVLLALGVALSVLIWWHLA